MHLIYPLIELPDDPAICRIVAGVVGLVETILPGHVHSYYLLGSQVDGATLETSDIDMSIVLRAPLDARPLGGLNDVLRCCSKISPYPIDVKIYELQTVRHLSVFGRPLLLFGTDLRPQLPPLSDAASLPIVLQFCLNEIAGCIDAAPPLTLPVKPPNEFDRYLGLANRLVRQPDGSEALGLKWLATSILWPAKALIFMKTGQWIPGKSRDLTAAFDAAVGPPWSWLVTVPFSKMSAALAA